MGNAGSNIQHRERHKSSSSDVPSSPTIKYGQAFEFDKKSESRLGYQGSSHEEEELPYYTKPVPAKETESPSVPELADSLKDGAVIDPNKQPALPTVFKWNGGGKQVYISGTFSEWKVLPMVRSHGDFVTIIDLPEGDHEYKFYVDGEWRHDPKLVSWTSQKQSTIDCQPKIIAETCRQRYGRQK